MNDNQQPPGDERKAWEGEAMSGKESAPAKSGGEDWQRDVLSRLSFAAVTVDGKWSVTVEEARQASSSSRLSW